MSNTTIQQKKKVRIVDELTPSTPVVTDELIAFCPKCKAFET